MTFGYTDVYFVENCKKRIFPEWSAFVEHQRKTRREKSEVLALTYPEFARLPVGTQMESFADSEYAKLKILGRNVDVIPLDVACKGLNGKDVSYIDRIYRIEKCRKRPYDIEKFLFKRRDSRTRLTELTSEQWISIHEANQWTLRRRTERKPSK